MAWFGADPGGTAKFGVALPYPDGSFKSAVVSCAEEAIEWLAKTGASIEAAGIDAPLWWSSGRTGYRKSDQRIRNGCDGLGSTVLSLNSLWGAALVQGVMTAILLRERFREVSITECHPKALLKAWGIDPTDLDASWKKARESFALADGPSRSDHERDALIAAAAAREGAAGRWRCDLAKKRCAFEQDPDRVPWGPVSYWWPKELSDVNEIECIYKD